MRHLRTLLLILATGSLPSVSSSASLFNPHYDPAFQLYSQQHLPENPWTLLKAQCYQESLLEPAAVSHVGAKGLCQFMPATWRDMQRRLKVQGSPFNPFLNIRFAAAYMRSMKNGWTSWRPDEPDRNNLALASYNAGLGNLYKAQKKCGGRVLYDEIIECLPKVTGRHSAETITYVKRTRRWYARLNK